MAGEPVGEEVGATAATQSNSVLARADQSRRNWENRRPWSPSSSTPAVEIQDILTPVVVAPEPPVKSDLAQEFFQKPIETRFENPLGEVVTDNKDKTRLEWKIDENRSIYLRPATFAVDKQYEEAVKIGKDLLQSFIQGQTIRIMEDEHGQPFELRDRVAKAILAGIEASSVSNIKPLTGSTSLTELTNEGHSFVIEKQENLGPARDKMTTLKWVAEEDVRALRDAQTAKTDT